jgi:hypothetical protein
MSETKRAGSGANPDLAALEAVIAEYRRRSKPKKVTLAGIISALRGLGEGTRVEVKLDGGHSNYFGHSLFIWRDHVDRTRYEMLDVGGGGGSWLAAGASYARALEALIGALGYRVNRKTRVELLADDALVAVRVSA